ncbi:MFS transporter, CP family, cyanate transporter [Streptomyces sp. cf386]|uniref:CynX/NimT family MFS transporter n=1 Tax=Streptomyces sp. cf386 TaxID=1761904 RepID=UPI00088E8D31|nr:MFS transporter [Streptomyces sp. cf386]SDP13441.1 MFS transporter, CP family, cyanate transporter [Streptomyces sp. cf386]
MTTRLWLITGLILLAVNLRAAITGTSPLIGDLRQALALSGTQVSMLATLPVLCLGAFAWLAPRLARRFGTQAAVCAALWVLALGAAVRAVPWPTALFVGTVLSGAGIAVGNVLLPALVKDHFSRRIGLFTGLTMTVMAVSGALAAGAAVPLADATGWQFALAVWAVPAVLAAGVWGLLAAPGADGRHRRTPPAAPTSAGGSLLRCALAWWVSAFLGLVSLMFYALVAWLPQIMDARGYTPGQAGLMMSVMLTVGIPLGFVVPLAAARMRGQRLLVVAVTATKLLSLAGLLLAPAFGWAWVCLLGAATGSAFPLAMTLLGLRADGPQTAAALSGMAQTIGYLLAGLGPLAIGVLHDVTDGWRIPLAVLVALVVPEAIAGLLAARPGHVRPGSHRDAPSKHKRTAARADDRLVRL